MKVSQALHEVKRTAANTQFDKECKNLMCDLDTLQTVLSSLDIESLLSETMSQADLMTISETLKTTATSLDELLSALDRTKHHPLHLNRHFSVGSLSRVLGTTQKTISTQKGILILLLSSRKLQRCADRSVLTLAFLGQASCAATSYPHPIEQMQRDNADEYRPTIMEDGFSREEKEDQRRRTAMLTVNECSQATVYLSPAAGLTEGGFIFAGAAGAAMMYIWDQYRDEILWKTDPAASDPTIHSQRLVDMMYLRPFILNSPQTLIASIALTTFAMSAYHYRHRHERHLDVLMMGVAGGGAIIGRVLGFDGTSVLLRIVPGCILISLILSTTVALWLAREPVFHDSDEGRDRASVVFRAM